MSCSEYSSKEAESMRAESGTIDGRFEKTNGREDWKRENMGKRGEFGAERRKEVRESIWVSAHILLPSCSSDFERDWTMSVKDPGVLW